MLVQLTRDGAVAVLTLTRPERRNAWGPDMEAELGERVLELGRDDSVRCIVLTGDARGKAFCAGANLKEGETHAPRRPKAFVESLDRLKDFAGNRLVDCPKPVIAAVNGYAIGAGFLLSVCADLIVASDRAEWRMPQASLGIVASYGSYARLLRRVGRGTVMRTALGFPMSADDAWRTGFAQWLVPHEQLMERAMEVARHIAGLAPLSVRLIKESVTHSAEIGNVNEASLVDLYRLMVLEYSADSEEAHAAWPAKRAPNFTGE